MKYRILILASSKENPINNLYKFYSEDDAIFETSDADVLDAKLESLLAGDYKQKQLSIVGTVDYTVDAKIDIE